MNKKDIFSFLSTWALITPAAYTMDSKEDLKRRVDVVSKQLEEHQRLNQIISAPQSTFYEAIKQAEEDTMINDLYEHIYEEQKHGNFKSVYTEPVITTPEAMENYELNKKANDAKHKWD